jgi:hypothetical protein
MSWVPRLRRLPWLADLRHDLQYGLRTFRKNPGFTAVAILTLALGVGATVTVFSVVEAVLLRPLPYQNGDRLVAIWLGHVKDKSLAKIFASYDDFEHWQRNSQTVEQFAAATWATGDQIVTGHGTPKVALAIPASLDFFSLLGVSPIRGRTFEAADLTRGCTVVLSHRFWQNTLAGQADIAGHSVALDSRACTIVGVMPERVRRARRSWRARVGHYSSRRYPGRRPDHRGAGDRRGVRYRVRTRARESPVWRDGFRSDDARRRCPCPVCDGVGRHVHSRAQGDPRRSARRAPVGVKGRRSLGGIGVVIQHVERA